MLISGFLGLVERKADRQVGRKAKEYGLLFEIIFLFLLYNENVLNLVVEVVAHIVNRLKSLNCILSWVSHMVM